MQRLQNPVSYEGWSIQVYGGDRRLLVSLDASHAWLFGIGIAVGFAIALVSLSRDRSTSAPIAQPMPQAAPLQLAWINHESTLSLCSWLAQLELSSFYAMSDCDQC